MMIQRLLLLCGILFVISFSVYSQSAIDSLKEQLIIESNDSIKMGILNQLRRQTIYTDPTASKEYVSEYISLAQKLGNGEQEAIGHYFLGNSHYLVAEYDSAVTLFLRATKYFESQKDSLRLPSMYNAVAACYQYTGTDEETLTYFRKSMAIARAKNDARKLAMVYNNISNIHERSGRFDSTFYYLNLARNIHIDREEMENLAFVNTNMANAYLKTNDLSKAKEFYESAVTVVSEDQNPLIHASSALGLGKIYLLEKNYSGAESIIEKGLKIANQHGFLKEEVDLSECLIDAQVGQGKKDEAIYSLKAYISLKDTLYNSEADANLEDALKKYESEEKDKEITLLASENIIKDLEISRTRLRSVLFGLGALALALGLALVFRVNRIRTKANQLLNEKNEKIETALKEKNLLLREIHHRVKNNLQTISSLLNLQSKYIEDDAALEAINEGRNRVASMAILHQNLYQEDNLKGIEMEMYFGQLAKKLFHAYNIKSEQVQLVTDIENLNLDIDTVVPIGLIMNELITNALKHAFPNEREGTIYISLKEVNDQLILNVRDDGVGIDLTQSNSKNTFGSKMIHAFSQKLKAEMVTDQNDGTSVILTINNYKKAA